jgi:acyl-CoA synthetase (AMP-forming)/AMP-acid ligase II
MPDGWFATGDLGKQDEEGYLFLLGRSKESISVAGVKFFPQEVEAVLELHPAVKEACVFAHEHERLGQVPYAQIVLEPEVNQPPSEVELREYCFEHLTAFKVPKHIEYLDTLERTASGKLSRRHTKLV